MSAKAGLSIELSFKAVEISEKEQFPRPHNLADLFKRCSEESKRLITSAVSDEIPNLEDSLKQLRHVCRETRYIEPHGENTDPDGKPHALSISPLGVNTFDTIAGHCLARAKALAVIKRRKVGRPA